MECRRPVGSQPTMVITTSGRYLYIKSWGDVVNVTAIPIALFPQQ